MNRFPWEKIFAFTPLDLGKILISALVIVIVNKVQIFNDRLSALLIALPLTSLLAMVWMHQSGQSSTRLANHAEGTFWFVLPTLPMFLIFPALMRNGWGFWPTLIINCLITAALFWLTVFVLRKFGYDLLPK